MNLITFLLLLGAALLVVLNLFTIYWFGGMLIPLFGGGGPYVPSSPERVKSMIKFANINPGETVIDLGSGDGRLLIAALDAGAETAIGYEIHHGLVKLSRHKLKKRGYHEHSKIIKQSMWTADIGGADVVFLYQIPHAMEKIGHKLQAELKKGTRVVSNGFEIPGWKPEKSEASIYLYKM